MSILDCSGAFMQAMLCENEIYRISKCINDDQPTQSFVFGKFSACPQAIPHDNLVGYWTKMDFTDTYLCDDLLGFHRSKRCIKTFFPRAFLS